MQRRKTELKTFTLAAMLLAIMVILAFTPLGFIGLGVISITIVHIPVLIALFTLGPGMGTGMGLLFGLLSLLKALTSPQTLMDPLFLNPLVSILPRVLMPLAAWGVFILMRKAFPKRGRLGGGTGLLVGSLAGSLANTIGVMGILWLLYGVLNVSMLGIVNPAENPITLSMIGGVILMNGLPEAALSVVVVPPIVLALQKAFPALCISLTGETA